MESGKVLVSIASASRARKERRKENGTYVGLSTSQDGVSVSKLDLVLFYSLDDLHILSVSDIPSFARRRGVSAM